MTIARHLVFGSSFHAFEFALGNTRITAFFDSSNLQGFAHMTSTLSKALVGACAALAIASAHAATATYSFDHPLSPTEISQTGSLGLFNSTLGTLTAASLTVDASLRATFSGTNNGANAQNAMITPMSDIGIGSTLAAVNALFGHDVALNPDFTLSVTSGVQNYAVGQTRSFGPFTHQGTVTKDLAAILAALSAPGGGTFDLTCDSLSGIRVLGGGGSIATTQATEARCGATITYTYTPAPPAPVNVPVGGAGTVALMGLAILGLAAGLRRKRR